MALQADCAAHRATKVDANSNTIFSSTLLTNGRHGGRDKIPGSGDTTVQAEAATENANSFHGPVTPVVREAGSFPRSWWAKIATCIVAGVIFGLAMEKGRVFEPHVIRNQMDFSCLIMLKMFVAAVSAVLITMSVLSVIPATSEKFKKARDNFICRLNAKGVSASAIGGALLGVGMAIGGACPGAVLVQMGARVDTAGYTFIGCVAGATVYGITEQAVSKWMRPKNIQNYRIDEIVGVPFWKVAVPLGASLALFVCLLELLVPWEAELTAPNQRGVSIVALRSWLPSFTGAMIGCMQVPVVLAMGQTMGGSGSYCTMAAQLIPTAALGQISPYLLRTKYGLNNWWSIAYGLAAVVGAVFSASMSGSLGSVVGVPPVHAFLGGLVMVYGSRLAGGCTSGHGMSGMGTLCLISFVAVPAMFAGGITTLAAMKIAGVA